MAACKVFFCFSCLYEQLQLLRMLIFWQEFIYLSKTTPYTKLESLSIPGLDLREKLTKVVFKYEKF